MYETRFLSSLVYTIVIETAVLFILVGFFSREIDVKKHFWRIAAAGIVCSGFTLPYVWFIFPEFISVKVMYMIAAEAWAVAAEAVILMWALRMKAIKSLLISLVCNASSFLLGKIAYAAGLL
jgi:hypothetical protein